MLTERELRYLTGQSLGSFWLYGEEIAEKECKTEELSEAAVVLLQRLKVRHGLSFKFLAFLYQLSERQIQVSIEYVRRIYRVRHPNLEN